VRRILFGRQFGFLSRHVGAVAQTIVNGQAHIAAFGKVRGIGNDVTWVRVEPVRKPPPWIHIITADSWRCRPRVIDIQVKADRIALVVDGVGNLMRWSRPHWRTGMM